MTIPSDTFYPFGCHLGGCNEPLHISTSPNTKSPTSEVACSRIFLVKQGSFSDQERCLTPQSVPSGASSPHTYPSSAEKGSSIFRARMAEAVIPL